MQFAAPGVRGRLSTAHLQIFVAGRGERKMRTIGQGRSPQTTPAMAGWPPKTGKAASLAAQPPAAAQYRWRATDTQHQ